MKHGVTLLFCAFLVLGETASAFTDSICTYDKSIPSLPKATCYYPPCTPTSCQPPTIDATSITSEFPEDPVMQNKDVCPDTTVSSPCWETFINMTVRVSVKGPVTQIGINVEQTVDGAKKYKKYWAKTEANDKGTYAIDFGIAGHVPHGKRLEVAIYEVCAKDAREVEGCITPVQKPAAGPNPAPAPTNPPPKPSISPRPSLSPQTSPH